MSIIDKLKGINLNEIQDETLKLKIQKAIEFFDDANDLSNEENKVLQKIFNQAEKAITKKRQLPIKVPAKPAPKYKRLEILANKDIDQLSLEDCLAMLKENKRIRLATKTRIGKFEKKAI